MMGNTQFLTQRNDANVQESLLVCSMIALVLRPDDEPPLSQANGLRSFSGHRRVAVQKRVALRAVI
jgi:hypothetical protein